MFAVNDRIQIPLEEMQWSFARSGGPGGQNVNKVSSKAVLHWDVGHSPALPDEVKTRLRALHGNRITADGVLVLMSQRFRQQDRNREDCLEKLREMVLAALEVPKTRKPTRVRRGAKEARLAQKRRRSATKQMRGRPED